MQKYTICSGEITFLFFFRQKIYRGVILSYQNNIQIYTIYNEKEVKHYKSHHFLVLPDFRMAGDDVMIPDQRI